MPLVTLSRPSCPLAAQLSVLLVSGGAKAMMPGEDALALLLAGASAHGAAALACASVAFALVWYFLVACADARVRGARPQRCATTATTRA
jgi:hypothetical protein